MFRSARWRSEKNKIKTVFRLHFHATQLKQLAGEALIISVIPAETGKPTARLEKSKVKDGSCYWEKPHYETVKFVHDPKNGKFHEKIYHFALATGSTKYNGVGEVSIDFAKFAEATKISSLCLPLKNANYAAFLHVSIQRVQESLDQREVDGSEKANRQDRSLRAQLSDVDVEEIITNNLVEEIEILSDGVNRQHQTSSGSDVTFLGSDSSLGLDTLREVEPRITNPTHEPPAETVYEEPQERASQWDLLDGSPPELSTDDSSQSLGDLVLVLEEISEDGSKDDLIKKLKTELDVFARQADVSELELHALRKQIVKERKKGQDLSAEVATLVEERNTFKVECEKLKAYRKSTEESKVKVNKLNEERNPWDLVDELRQELNYTKDLNFNLQLQLQKTQESNAELILAVQDLEEMLEEKNSDMSKSKCSKSHEFQEVKSGTDDDEDQKALEELFREHSGVQETYLLKQKITDLYNEIELYKRDRDELEMQMEQIALDYEILKQGNHDMSCKLEQSQLQEQLKMQYECTSYTVVNELEAQIECLNKELKVKSKELSDSVLVIEELETHVKNLEKDLEDQANGFEADIEDLIIAKVEQEQRAIRVEESLRKMRTQNANTAERLQEDFRRLSTQMTSTFKTNEKTVLKAMDEANKLHVEKRHLEGMLEELKRDLDYLGVHYEEKLFDLLQLIDHKSKQLEKMEKEIAGISTELEYRKIGYTDEIEKLKTDKQNLENERKDLEKNVSFAKMELETSKKELIKLADANKQKDGEYQKLQSEIERIKSLYDDMQLSLVEGESETEKLRKQMSQLKGELILSQDALSSIKKKLNDSCNRVMVLEGSKAASRNDPHSANEVSTLTNRIEQLEGQIKLKEAALYSSETLFLEKERDLQQKTLELERRLKDLEQSTAVSQASRADEMESLKSLNESMEVELMEMQKRYSEISLKFAEVEGERQKLIMTLRNIKNTKKY